MRYREEVNHMLGRKNPSQQISEMVIKALIAITITISGAVKKDKK